MKVRHSRYDVAQWILILAAASIICFLAWFSQHLTARDISHPMGIYTAPYRTHGGTVFISRPERFELWSAYGAGFALVIAQCVLNGLRRRVQA